MESVTLAPSHSVPQLDSTTTPLHLVSALLHIDEPHTRAFLGNQAGEDKLEGWYLDSSAMHHMTGRIKPFTELDRGIHGSVKFNNDSAVEICGVG